jgi:hypothetical protein
MTNGVVALIEMLRIHTIKLAHGLAQVRFDRLDHQVKVVGHHTKAVHDAVMAIADYGEHFQPSSAVGIIPINQAAAVATRRNVVQGTGKFQSKWSGHPPTLEEA